MYFRGYVAKLVVRAFISTQCMIGIPVCTVLYQVESDHHSDHQFNRGEFLIYNLYYSNYIYFAAIDPNLVYIKARVKPV
jgi:hypothetical protein